MVSALTEAEARAHLIRRERDGFRLAVRACLDLNGLTQTHDQNGAIGRLVSADGGGALRSAEERAFVTFAADRIIKLWRLFAWQAHDERERAAGLLYEEIVVRMIGLLEGEPAAVSVAQRQAHHRIGAFNGGPLC